MRHLSVIRADPNEYVKRYGPTLKKTSDLPNEVLEIKHPEGIKLASDVREDESNSVAELVGDVDALRLVDLEREGLSEYMSYIKSRTSETLNGKTNSKTS